jgi:hypothetical protein
MGGMEMSELVKEAVDDADVDEKVDSFLHDSGLAAAGKVMGSSKHVGDESPHGSRRASRSSSFTQGLKKVFGGGGEKGETKLEEHADLHPDIRAALDRANGQNSGRRSRRASKATLQGVGEDEEEAAAEPAAQPDAFTADEPEDEAFDVMVGSCPFLERTISAFVRLKRADIVGELAEEGYRTRDLFLCLGPQEDSEEVWQIGRR